MLDPQDVASPWYPVSCDSLLWNSLWMSENNGPITEAGGVAWGSVEIGCNWLCMVWIRRLTSTGEQERLKLWVEQYEEVKLSLYNCCCLWLKERWNNETLFIQSEMQTRLELNVVFRLWTNESFEHNMSLQVSACICYARCSTVCSSSQLLLIILQRNSRFPED